jgi:hypothetical protein
MVAEGFSGVNDFSRKRGFFPGEICAIVEKKVAAYYGNF